LKEGRRGVPSRDGNLTVVCSIAIKLVEGELEPSRAFAGVPAFNKSSCLLVDINLPQRL
jgi:hypothetical protein